MGKISLANLKKTSYYLKRNGLKRTFYAVRERLDERKQPPYVFNAPSEAQLQFQREQSANFTVSFSILVPAYRTREEYLREMIGSLQAQTYPNWELLLADATPDDSVEKVVCAIADERIRYIRLEQNAGIAENTNQGLQYANGDYVGLLDHDDLLTPDALYEMAAAIEESRSQGAEFQMLYSDEDKCNGDATEYYEPNFKEKFNLDLLLSNNYICHFLVMKRELIRELGFRSEFDGAQDFDLVLRAAGRLLNFAGPYRSNGVCQTDTIDVDTEKSHQALICHIPKVLYHWRCHTGSTAENPQSKLYAYEAGKRAIADFAAKQGWHVEVKDTPHVGFYIMEYLDDIFAVRSDIGAVGGVVTGKSAGRKVPEAAGAETGGTASQKKTASKCILSGRLTADGTAVYRGLSIHYSGYLHRAILPQNADAVDIRNVRLRQECHKIFEKVVGVPYATIPGTQQFDVTTLPENCDYIALSVALGEALRAAGWRILYLPIHTPT